MTAARKHPTTPPAATRIAEIRERLSKRTPGEWVNMKDDHYYGRILAIPSDQVGSFTDIAAMPEGDDRPDDFDLIAHAPDDLRFLADRLKRAEALLGMIDRGHPDVEAYFNGDETT